MSPNNSTLELDTFKKSGTVLLQQGMSNETHAQNKANACMQRRREANFDTQVFQEMREHEYALGFWSTDQKRQHYEYGSASDYVQNKNTYMPLSLSASEAAFLFKPGLLYNRRLIKNRQKKTEN